MDEKQIKRLNEIFKDFPKVKLVYFFGSRAENNASPLSDYDFAIYLDEKDKKKMFEIKIKVQNKIVDILKTDKVDVVILNTTQSPDLKYDVIKNGQLIFEKEPFKLTVEPKILNEYFDFNLMLLKHGLTK
ncbi:nucleotidyltransferase domain-containing protein [Patescibacteria group bacterium]|nr:nucleotidyltransferase domain-containing protein [Patescibacteria group bacterium]MBU1563837.1 nucleotidyltransferase domain-containing protein [Patescibacteria group bacterium]MBU2068349.1 nucleotidyltransferase domain-containing protein [Patescibacteria group bacterium]